MQFRIRHSGWTDTDAWVSNDRIRLGFYPRDGIYAFSTFNMPTDSEICSKEEFLDVTGHTGEIMIEILELTSD